MIVLLCSDACRAAIFCLEERLRTSNSYDLYLPSLFCILCIAILLLDSHILHPTSEPGFGLALYPKLAKTLHLHKFSLLFANHHHPSLSTYIIYTPWLVSIALSQLPYYNYTTSNFLMKYSS
jgi:hypothetical protein